MLPPTNLPPIYHAGLTSTFHKNVLQHRTTAVRNTSESRSSPVDNSLVPPRSSPAANSRTSRLQSGRQRRPGSDLRALQGSREALKSRPVTYCTVRSRTGLHSAACRGWGFRCDSPEPPRWTFTGWSFGGKKRKTSPAELLTHQCVSACVFTLSNVHSARESTLGK